MADEPTTQQLMDQIESLKGDISGLREQLVGDKGQLESTEGMSPEQILEATQEGRLNDYLQSKNK